MPSCEQQEQMSRKQRVMGGSFGLFYTWTRQGIFNKKEFEEIIREVVEQQVREREILLRSQFQKVANSEIERELLNSVKEEEDGIDKSA